MVVERGHYILNTLEYKIRSDCNCSDPDSIKYLFAEIINPKGKNITVGSIYRPPNQNHSSLNDR
jgi:hypothetical protein